MRSYSGNQGRLRMLQFIRRSIHQRCCQQRMIALVVAAISLAQISLGGAVAQAASQSAPAAQAKVAIVRTPTVNLLVAPGGAATTQLKTGDAVQATGRSADGAWVYVTTDVDQTGWIPAADLVIFSLATLPVLTVEMAAFAATQPVEITTSDAEIPADESLERANESAATLNSAPSVLSTALPTTTGTMSTEVSPPMVEIISKGLNVRVGPGVGYGVLTTVKAGEQYDVSARNSAGSWVQIDLGDGQTGWVSAGYVALSAPLAELPVADEESSQFSGNSKQLSVSNEQSSFSNNQATDTNQVVTTSAPTKLTGKLVISTGNGGLFYLYNLETGELRPLTSGYDPALSPDGTRIVFRRGGGENGIYAINSDGGGERKLFDEREGLSSPKWSPDGQWIVFSRLDGSYTCRDLGRGICVPVHELFGDAPNDLPEEQQERLNDARHSMLTNFPEEERPNWILAIINSEGREYRDLAALNSAQTPDWSTAGIVYQSKAGLQQTSAATDAETRAVLSDHYLHDPDWQQGGERIVYQSRRGSHWELFAVNPNGSGNSALTRPTTTLVDQLPSNVSPAWSPDGQQIVFLSNRQDDHGAGVWRVWVMDADGGNQRPLPIDLPISYSYAGEQMVDWAP